MYVELPIPDHAREYQSFRYELRTPPLWKIMEVNGYSSGQQTGSPLPYYVAVWPGTGISPPAITAMQATHYDLAVQANWPTQDLRYAMYATKGDQEYDYPLLDTLSLPSVVFNLLQQQEPDFIRIDGTFWGVSMERSQSLAPLPTTCFFSFFNLCKFIYGIYTISSRDAARAPGRAVIEGDLEYILNRFPDLHDIGKFKETIYELQKS